jgi:DNA polymerase-3 subunit alpha (Gram-positive type)
MDNAPEKRVELHCHTRMSDMDGVSSVEDLMERAAEWGHKALAITDHGVVQSFTDAFHALPAIRKKHPEFKVIYGLEGYLVDDSTGIVVNERGQSFDGKFIVFDIETTGFSPQKNKIIEIGAVKIINGEIIGSFHSFINPGERIPSMITKLTSITDEMVANAPAINIILPEFLEYCEGAVLVAHNARFDMGFITQKARDMEIETNFTYIDTVAMARALLPNLGRFKLDNVAKALNVSLENHHRATDDAKCTANIFLKLSEMLKEHEINDLSSLYEFGRSSADIIKKGQDISCDDPCKE